MAILLKTASVRVSFIQIMLVRVQNKGKSVWKSRYVGDVSEPRTDSRSALPREIRAWWRLRVVKRDETFSLGFFSARRNIWSWSWGRWMSRGPTRQGACPGEGRAPHPHGQGVGPLAFIFCQYFLYLPKIISVDFQVIPRTFVFCTINNIMAVLLKTTSVRVSFIQIMLVRVQNKGKSVWKSRYVGDVSMTSYNW